MTAALDIIGAGFLASGLLVLLGGTLGNLTGRRGVFALALGVLAASGGANLALWALRAAEGPVWATPLLALPLAALLAALTRLTRIAEPRAAPPVSWRDLGIALAPAVLLIWLHPILFYPGPTATSNFFNGWVPVWLEASREAGHFFDPERSALGRGFLTSADYYEWNLLGLNAAMAATGLPVPPVFNGLSRTVQLLAFVLVFLGIGVRGRWAWGVGAGLVFALPLNTGSHFYFLRSAWDEHLLLCGAAAFHAIARPGSRPARLGDLLAVVGFVGWGRRFAAIPAALIGGAACLWLWREKSLRPVAFMAVMTIGAVALSRPLAIIATHDWQLDFPRSEVDPALITTDLAGHLLGGATDLGLLMSTWLSDLHLPAPLGLWLPLLILLWWRGQRFDVLPVVMIPLLFAGTFAMEIALGYRSSPIFNKLYIFAYPAVLGFSAVLLRELGVFRTSLRRQLKRAGAILLWALVIKAKTYAIWALLLVGYLDDRPTELRLVAALRQEQGTQAAAAILNDPLIYVHYEPGIGLRNFTGGDLRNDLDFWSDPVQSALASGPVAAWIALGRPTVYISHGSGDFYALWSGIDTWSAFRAALETAPGVCRFDHDATRQTLFFDCARMSRGGGADSE